MAGTNTIGTGAVVLTANADKLAAGLDKATRDINRFADRASKKGGGGGGLLGGLMVGGVAGGVAGGIGALTAVVGKGVEYLHGVFTTLQERASKVQLAPDVRAGVNVADRAVRQLGNTYDTVLLMAVSKIAPAMEKIIPAVEAALFIAEGLFEAVVDWVGEAVTSFADWVGATGTLSSVTNDAGAAMFAVFRKVGEVVAYAWDTLREGASVAVQVAGTIVKAFGVAAQAIASVAQSLKDASDFTGNALSSAAGFGNVMGGRSEVAATFDAWGKGLEALGKKTAEWGKGIAPVWGDAAQQIAGWVDRIQGRFEKRIKVPMAGLEAPKLAAALGRGDAQAYSIVAKYQTANGGPESMDKRQLNATEKVFRAVKEGFDMLKGSQILRVAG